MKGWFQCIAVIGALLIAYPSFSAEPVVGAFGIELGARASDLEKDMELGWSSNDGKFKSISVTPPLENDLLSSYYIKVDVESNRVFAIEASNIIEGKSSCLSVVNDIGQHLQRKYGVSFELETHGDPGEMAYMFYMAPSGSSNIIAGGCRETNMEQMSDSPLDREDKGFFYDDEKVLYSLLIVYGSEAYFNRMYNSDGESMMDATGF